ncbi:MAG: AraC family transcriptional regulator [Reyranellaceae bacterium]
MPVPKASKGPPTRGIISIGTTRVGSISALPAVLERLGVGLEPILDEVGLPRSLFESPDSLVDIGKAKRLLDLAAARAGCPHLGLLCGQRHRPETIGIAGRLAQNARDVGSALRGLTLNLHLNGHAFMPSLTVTADTAEFALRLATDLPGPTRPVVDLGMAGAFAIVQAICGPAWTPTGVLLVHQPGGSRVPYDKFYGVPVQFGSNRNAIVFPAPWLGRRVHGADPDSLALLERELAVIADRNRLPPATATRRALLACIARGDVSVRAVAAASGLHPRALNRRLARERTSVFELLKLVRYQISRDLLENTSLPVTEIAATLGYASTGSFTRAFRLWSGMSPRDWRPRRRPASRLQARPAGPGGPS